RPISWCAPGSRPGAGLRQDLRARYSTSWSSGARRRRSPARANSEYGATAGSFGSASLTRKPEPMTRAGLIERLADRHPGRRGFRGYADPLARAAHRLDLRRDHELNQGNKPPNTALGPAAGLAPMINDA